ncbi:Der GTPase-activating protein YihI [Zophobihabitans entericus]|uniref:Der GTPase-activating protein YihI n=1 Tax=Zophobihabitans entericus TaxID=1635327 RepID=A0A6G9IBW4_9GAMM|nr:Der GTPase-activating protein YihI [Zophobihabitans entericus]QIQ21726.1 GTPase-activating protein [Zophobihabitans entericus]
MANYIPKSKKQKKTRQELNEEGRLLKKKRKHKGLPSGTRHSDASKQNNGHGGKAALDPRTGSKTPIPLIADGKVSTTKAKPAAEKVKLSPMEELTQLENNTKLEQLLDRLEQGESLSTEEQRYVDRSLDRIEVLMEKLGLQYEGEDDDDEEDDKPEDIMSLLKKQ